MTRKMEMEMDKFYYIQFQAPAGNWVDSIGTQDLKDAKRHLSYEKKLKREKNWRIIRRYSEVIES